MSHPSHPTGARPAFASGYLRANAIFALSGSPK
jgi:hypothetical protein